MAISRRKKSAERLLLVFFFLLRLYGEDLILQYKLYYYTIHYKGRPVLSLFRAIGQKIYSDGDLTPCNEAPVMLELNARSILPFSDINN